MGVVVVLSCDRVVKAIAELCSRLSGPQGAFLGDIQICCEFVSVMTQV